MNNVSKWMHNVNSTLRRASSTSSAASTHGYNAYNRSWIHPPDVLLNAYVEYTVKYMGDVAVDQPKGTHVIKEAIHRLRFNLDLKRSQGCYQLPKVELHVSVKGVKIVDPKSKMILFNHPLHKISFCADDKHDKRLFAFIAKQKVKSSGGGNAARVDACPAQVDSTAASSCVPSAQEEQRCFVFLSDKLAEQITLTIGEAFDLAYRKFLDSNNNSSAGGGTLPKSVNNGQGSHSQLMKLINLLRKRIQELERENDDLKQQLAQFVRSLSKDDQESVGKSEKSHKSTTLTKWESFDSVSFSAAPVAEPPPLPPAIPSSPVPPPPQGLQCAARSFGTNGDDGQHHPFAPSSKETNGDVAFNSIESAVLKTTDLVKGLSLADHNNETKMNILFDDADKSEVFDTEFDPRAFEQRDKNKQLNFSLSTEEMTCEELAREIQRNEALLAEMRDGYKRGLTFGHGDFGTTSVENSEDLAVEQNLEADGHETVNKA